MNMPEIDPRLEGKSVRDITDKFIRENATEDELSTIYKEPVEIEKCDYIPLDSCDRDSSLGFAKRLYEILSEKPGSYICDMECYGIEISTPVISMEKVKPVDYLKKLWKNQIRELEEFQKEYEEWLRLNEKFGEEN